MIVVRDTSAITSLIQIDRIAVLRQLYGAILIPPSVERELRFHHSALAGFIETVPIHDREGAARLLLELNQGEAEAIVLAKEIKANVLLINEQKGRAVALREGVPIIGLVGALIAANLSSALGYWPRVLLLAAIGALATIDIDASYWNWYAFPTPFLLAQFLDHVGGWFLAGLVLARICRPK